MRVTFWGVRGSIPAPGPSTGRYGGNSSCVEIAAEGLPPLVLDLGTGARPLGQDLVARPERELFLLLTHYHIDHVMGFPFFAPIYAPSFKVRMHLPTYDHREPPQGHLTQFLNGVFHPLRLPEIPASIHYVGIRPGSMFQCGPYRVQGVPMNHPGGSCGYRIEHGGRVVAYFTDTAPFASPGEGVMAGRPPTDGERMVITALQGVDLAVVDAMFSYEDYLRHMGWGHAYPEYVVALAKAAGVRRLCLFHHAPEATDDDLDRLARRWAEHRDPVVTVAHEGGTVDLEG